MPKIKSPLKIDEIVPRFSLLLNEAGTSLEHPALEATWSAFATFCREPLACDEERLFFECGLSESQPDSFYVHFARTCYGREPKGHIWSYEVICDFLFPRDKVLNKLDCTIEMDELPNGSEEREQFLDEVQNQEALWQALSQRRQTAGQIYIGES